MCSLKKFWYRKSLVCWLIHESHKQKAKYERIKFQHRIYKKKKKHKSSTLFQQTIHMQIWTHMLKISGSFEITIVQCSLKHPYRLLNMIPSFLITLYNFSSHWNKSFNFSGFAGISRHFIWKKFESIYNEPKTRISVVEKNIIRRYIYNFYQKYFEIFFPALLH